MQIGMIGLGRMGENMVRRLMDHGHDCVVHDVVAAAPDASREQLTEQLERRWPELGLRPGWVAERQLHEALGMVDRYARYVAESRAAGRELIGTEIGLAVTVGPDDTSSRGVELRGTVDRLERDPEGNLVVLDLKTSRTKPAAAEIERHAQLGSYQVAVEEGAFEQVAPGARSGGAQLVQLGTGTRGPTTQAQRPLTQDEDPAWARTMLLDTGAGMAGSTFPARVGTACRTCSARFSCPMQPEGQGR